MAEADNPETLLEARVLRVYDGNAPVDPPPKSGGKSGGLRSPFLDDYHAPIRVAPDAPAPAKTSERKPLRPMIGKDPDAFREFQRVFRNWDFRIGTF